MIIKGDINGDGRINNEDLTLCQMYLLGHMSFTEEEFEAADTNGDGKISIVDLGNIQKHLLGRLIINEVIE